MPYEWNKSQDVEKCTVDLVLSSPTHTNAVQATAVASKGCWFFLQCPLTMDTHDSHLMLNVVLQAEAGFLAVFLNVEAIIIMRKKGRKKEDCEDYL